MFSKDNRLESMPARKRVSYGKQVESQIIKSLREQGLVIEDVPRNVDCNDKIDCYLLEEGTKKACQIKCRMGYSGSDFLLDLYEPYYGMTSEDTKKGRDYISEYDKYICLSRDTIYVIDGKLQKKLVERVLEEWKAFRYELPIFNSVSDPGVQIRFTSDKSNGRPKILMFVSPDVFSEKDVKKYKLLKVSDV